MYLKRIQENLKYQNINADVASFVCMFQYGDKKMNIEEWIEVVAETEKGDGAKQIAAHNRSRSKDSDFNKHTSTNLLYNGDQNYCIKILN